MGRFGFRGVSFCACGHSEESHYTYILNGHEQVTCRGCDPTAGWPPGDYVLSPEQGQQRRDADHDFKPTLAP